MKATLIALTFTVLIFPTFAQDKPVTIDEILRMLRQDVPEATIAEEVRARGCRCEASIFDIMALKGAGASDELLRAIQQEGNTSRPIPSQTAEEQEHQTPQSTQPVSSPVPTRVTVFGGYSYGRSVGDLGTFNWNGFNGAVTGHVNDWLGITGDLSWQVSELVPTVDVDLLHAGVGPQFSTWGRTRRVRGFGHVLFGVTRVDAELIRLITGENPITTFSTAVGGGLDVGVTKSFGIRVFQSDWIRLWDLDGESGDFVRLSFGVVGRF